MIKLTFNELAQKVHADNIKAGWWDKCKNKRDRFSTARFLVVSELVEAGEGARKDLMDDHLPEHKMFDVELADAAIRLLDMGGAYTPNMDLSETVVRGFIRELNKCKNPLEQLDHIAEVAFMTGVGYMARRTLSAVVALAEIHEIDLWVLIDEKRTYNKTRADHQKENRAKKGGKKW